MEHAPSLLSLLGAAVHVGAIIVLGVMALLCVLPDKESGVV